MTAEMQLALERELEDAKTAEDISRAQSHIMIALMDCQRKTAERVKELCTEREAAKQRLAGAKIAVTIAKGVVAVGGPTAAIYLCKLLGILW